MLLSARPRDGLDEVALKSSSAPSSHKNSKGWRGVPRPYFFGVPPTPMNGSQLLVSGQGPLRGGVVALEAFHLDCEITLPGTSLSRFPCASTTRPPDPRNSSAAEELELASGSSGFANKSNAAGPAR